jgi:hypothetical protein
MSLLHWQFQSGRLRSVEVLLSHRFGRIYSVMVMGKGHVSWSRCSVNCMAYVMDLRIAVESRGCRIQVIYTHVVSD